MVECCRPHPPRAHKPPQWHPTSLSALGTKTRSPPSKSQGCRQAASDRTSSRSIDEFNCQEARYVYGQEIRLSKLGLLRRFLGLHFYRRFRYFRCLGLRADVIVHPLKPLHMAVMNIHAIQEEHSRVDIQCSDLDLLPLLRHEHDNNRL